MDYPKMLYKGGNAYDPETGRAVPHQDTLVVNDPAEEAAAEAEGFEVAKLPEDLGDDTLADSAGDDLILGHEGEDTLGGAGDETVAGEAGDDTLGGSAGADILADDPNTAAVVDAEQPAEEPGA